MPSAVLVLSEGAPVSGSSKQEAVQRSLLGANGDAARSCSAPPNFQLGWGINGNQQTQVVPVISSSAKACIMTSVPPHASLPCLTRRSERDARCGETLAGPEPSPSLTPQPRANKCATPRGERVRGWGGRRGYRSNLLAWKSRAVPLEAERRSGKMNFGTSKAFRRAIVSTQKPTELMISLSRLVSLRSGWTKWNAHSQSRQ